MVVRTRMVMSSLEAAFAGFLPVLACPKAGKEVAGKRSVKHKNVRIDFDIFIISICLSKLLIKYSKAAGDKWAGVALAVSLSFPFIWLTRKRNENRITQSKKFPGKLI
jgi:hypothetical protein